jgi:hypothetical protein
MPAQPIWLRVAHGSISGWSAVWNQKGFDPSLAGCGLKHGTRVAEGRRTNQKRKCNA